jgi:hypothetical protein
MPVVLCVTWPSRFNGNPRLLRLFNGMPNINEEPPESPKPVKLLTVSGLNKNQI